MAFENGVNWKPIDPAKRGRHSTFEKAVGSALASLVEERNEFFDSLADEWERLFPGLPMKPGRYESGIVFLYVRSSPLFFMMRPKLRAVKEKLSSLPGAPAKLRLKLEIHSR